VSTLEAAIDELYARPLDEFTAARNALAKSLSGDDRRRVSRLAKPTLVPWLVNQLYWRSRPVWQRLMESGDALRTGQVATLKGRPADIARLTASHRKALAEAVKEAGGHSSSQPDVNELSQMLEAISLGAHGGEQAGRFTKLVRPSGFEALAGIVPAARIAAPEPRPAAHQKKQRDEKSTRDAERRRHDLARREEAERKRQEQDAAQARKRAAARLKTAEDAFKRAEAAERSSRERFERAQDMLVAAKRELEAARSENG
jgi:hypothetical protein